MSSNVHALELGRAPKRVDVSRPDRADVETALRTIIRWVGDDPERPGLIDTPARVARAFEEFFAGYGQDPALILEKTFEEIEGYDEMIVLRGIRFESHCEHPWRPRAAYVPTGRVVGISKLARVVDAYASPAPPSIVRLSCPCQKWLAGQPAPRHFLHITWLVVTLFRHILPRNHGSVEAERRKFLVSLVGSVRVSRVCARKTIAIWWHHPGSSGLLNEPREIEKTEE